MPKPRFIFDNYRFNEDETKRYAQEEAGDSDLSSEEQDQKEQQAKIE